MVIDCGVCMGTGYQGAPGTSLCEICQGSGDVDADIDALLDDAKAESREQGKRDAVARIVAWLRYQAKLTEGEAWDYRASCRDEEETSAWGESTTYAHAAARIEAGAWEETDDER